MSRDHYAALELTQNATQEEIKKAHRRLVHQYHPDAGPTEAARERFHQIQEAYEVLSDTKRRAAYDRQLRGQGVATYRQNQAAADRQGRAQPQNSAPPKAEPLRHPPPPPLFPPIAIPPKIKDALEKLRRRATDAMKKIDWAKLRRRWRRDG